MERTLTVYYTTDCHGYFSPVDYATGKEAPSGLADCITSFIDDGNTLIIDGGDTMQGSPLTMFLQRDGGRAPRVTADVLNSGGYHFVTLGNHDFDYGKEAIEQYLDLLRAECLCANVSGIRGIKNFAVAELKNGLRIGLTGITTDFVTRWEKSETMDGIVVSDPVSAAERALNKLKSLRVDMTACIYHGGFERNPDTGEILSETGEDRAWEICETLGFDLLLTGHRHMNISGKRLFHTYICGTEDKARSYIKAVAAFPDGSSSENGVSIQSELLPAENVPSKKVMKILSNEEMKAGAWMNQPIGRLSRPLLSDSYLNLILRGSSVADLINMVQMDAAKADISVTSLSNHPKDLPENVTLRDVLSVYTFSNTLTVIEVTRDILERAMERQADFLTTDGGEFSLNKSCFAPVEQFYNFDFFYGLESVVDCSKEKGVRVVSIRFQGEELSRERVLRLALNSYRASGAGGYDFYRACPRVREILEEISVMISEYFMKQCSVEVKSHTWTKFIINNNQR